MKHNQKPRSQARTQQSAASFHPGKKMRGYCWNCDAMRQGTYDIGPYPLDDGEKVDGVMRATCDTCGEVIAMAHQSVPMIKAALTKTNAQKMKKERSTVRVPEALAIYSSQLLMRLGLDKDRFDLLIKIFMQSYFHSTDNEKESFRSILRFPDCRILHAPQSVKFHMNFKEELWERIEQLRMDTGIESTSELVRRMLVVLVFGLVVTTAEEMERANDWQRILKFAKNTHLERQAADLALVIA